MDRPLNLNAGTHRLSDIGKEIHPLKCQSCGRTKEECPIDRGPERWQECDHNDRPEHRLVVLCRACSKKLIEPHPRLYHRLSRNQPWPGAMEICVDCELRFGTQCRSANAKANGGPGVMLKVKQPTVAFVDGVRGGKRTGWVEHIWLSPASECKDRRPVK